jgi:hypothetical protein
MYFLLFAFSCPGLGLPGYAPQSLSPLNNAFFRLTASTSKAPCCPAQCAQVSKTFCVWNAGIPPPLQPSPKSLRIFIFRLCSYGMYVTFFSGGLTVLTFLHKILRHNFKEHRSGLASLPICFPSFQPKEASTLPQV